MANLFDLQITELQKVFLEKVTEMTLQGDAGSFDNRLKKFEQAFEAMLKSILKDRDLAAKE